MSSFAIYRLPHEDQCTILEQRTGLPAELPSYAALNGRQGFVMAPFAITQDCALLLIRPDAITTQRIENLQLPATCQLPEDISSSGAPFHETTLAERRASYTHDFRQYHACLLSGAFRKIVLARCATEHQPDAANPVALFQKACKLYPRLFISLVYTPQSGLWLAATPEILLEGDGRQWRTIALAGTMRVGSASQDDEGQDATWSTKNIQEQRYVSTYLTERLSPLVSDLHEEGPHTVRAANLLHLRSDVTFTLSNNRHVGDLLQALHPTPAVSGLPKESAVSFILRNEHTPRRYYSGFMGPLALHAPHASTHLYVSLRCMQIVSNDYRLYAGGGLLKDSIEEQEWQETEAKMETMRQLLSYSS